MCLLSRLTHDSQLLHLHPWISPILTDFVIKPEKEDRAGLRKAFLTVSSPPWSSASGIVGTPSLSSEGMNGGVNNLMSGPFS